MDSQLLALRREWYKKLARSGFKDAEKMRRDGEMELVEFHTHYISARYSVEAYLAKVSYFQMAGAFLWGHKWKSKREKNLWALHVDGVSNRKIAQKIGKSPSFVDQLIRRLSKLMLSEVYYDAY